MVMDISDAFSAANAAGCHAFAAQAPHVAANCPKGRESMPPNVPWVILLSALRRDMPDVFIGEKATASAPVLQERVLRFINLPVMGAMLSRMISKEKSSAKPPRKHAGFAKAACFRGDRHYFMVLQTSRESTAPWQ